MNKFVASAKFGGAADIEAQLSGDYVGKRYATYTNDLDIPGYFLMGLSVSGKLPVTGLSLKNLRWSISVTNLLNREGPLQPVVGQASGSYATYPIPPRMGFFTLKGDI
jgi:outer membrane receptor protein involved in Fe transport